MQGKARDAAGGESASEAEDLAGDGAVAAVLIVLGAVPEGVMAPPHQRGDVQGAARNLQTATFRGDAANAV